MPSRNGKIIIVGSGVFGLTLALELSRRGYRDITVMDRYLPPVPDSSSVDISRVIRPDYADPFYAKMGTEALQGWQNEYKDYFYKSGLLCLSQQQSHPYIESSRQNLDNMGMRVVMRKGNEIKDISSAIQGEVSHMSGYWNDVCGWANAEGAIRHLAFQCSQAGVSFLCGPRGTVTTLVQSGKQIKGVVTQARTTVLADTVIIATGAWTPYLVSMEKTSISTGQPVAFLQLTDEEAKAMQGLPVIIDITTGWFCFPPTPGTNILKMARHGYGYETSRQTVPVSTSSTTTNNSSDTTTSAPACNKNNAASTFIPEDADRALREGLALFFPSLKDRPFLKRRLCWYTDTATGDFVVDYHPSYDNLFMACGGSGHAFKFLPILGKYTADSFESRASDTQRKKWSWRESDTPISKGDGSRGGPERRRLQGWEQAKL